MELIHLGEESNPQVPSDYLQNIQEIINIKLDKGDTFNDLFSKLQKKFEGRPDALKTINEWIEFNKNEHKNNPEVFNTVACESEYCYQVFDLRP